MEHYVGQPRGTTIYDGTRRRPTMRFDLHPWAATS